MLGIIAMSANKLIDREALKALMIQMKPAKVEEPDDAIVEVFAITFEEFIIAKLTKAIDSTMVSPDDPEESN